MTFFDEKDTTCYIAKHFTPQLKLPKTKLNSKNQNLHNQLSKFKNFLNFDSILISLDLS